MKLTGKQVLTMANALRVAAETYERDAEAVKIDRLSAVFRQQATDARTLGDMLEQCDSVEVMA